MPTIDSYGIPLACGLIMKNGTRVLGDYTRWVSILVLGFVLGLITAIPAIADTPDGGQTPNSGGAAPAQAGNRDLNQPAMRQKDEINNSTPSFPTAVNPTPGNSVTKSPGMTPAIPATQPSPVTPPPPPDPAIEAADLTVQQAQKTFDNERNRVLATLRDKPEFKAAMARKDQSSLKVADATPTTRPAEAVDPGMMNAAAEKLNVSSELTKMQEQAVSADPAAAAAKKRLDDALLRRNKLDAGIKP